MTIKADATKYIELVKANDVKGANDYLIEHFSDENGNPLEKELEIFAEKVMNEVADMIKVEQNEAAVAEQTEVVANTEAAVAVAQVAATEEQAQEAVVVEEAKATETTEDAAVEVSEA